MNPIVGNNFLLGLTPWTEHGALAVCVVGVRDPRAVLVLLARQPTGGIVSVAGSQAPAVDAQGLRTRGVILEPPKTRSVTAKPTCHREAATLDALEKTGSSPGNLSSP
jgi:hypothetical protein